MALISLHAQLRSGKDTFAQIVKKHYPRQSERIAFADKLKESVCAIFKISPQDLENLKNDTDSIVMCGNKDNIQTVMPMRELLQRFGTEGHRDIFGLNFWVDQALSDLPLINHKKKLYIVTDCRFENEIKRVKELGGYVVNIKRENKQDQKSEVLHHSSEQDLSHLCDYFVDNNGTLEDFESCILDLLNTLTQHGIINLNHEAVYA